MSIRKARMADLQEILEIDAVQLVTNWHERLYIDEIVGEQSVFDVLDVDGHVMGFILFRINNEIADLLQFAVHVDFMHQGFGTVLFENVLVELREKGVSTVFLEVREHNDRAVSFYKKFDFERMRQRNNYYGPDDHAWVMRKVL
ncbi:ribosomal protein S18-alanine N-acetyltransferase [Erysipelothrix sp. HDW6C]|uniref:ribosomal protein S18-alanine N-acetyltransferase n=1 Tax=Erysipelothrix sp. HDW6C TaxID=2714930 RepID=UPI00140872EF|nr:ribosomal protein S18-alanine N-acetyltransferase [Erysipelothrix sp. HDW6C]QIK69925.1 ribosomal protein S18-alanine N-acetyltransferase [Erysipelothrix sp. HDW6C]